MPKETPSMVVPSQMAKERASFYTPIFGGGGKLPTMTTNTVHGQFEDAAEDARDEDVNAANFLTERGSSTLAEDFYPPAREGVEKQPRKAFFATAANSVEEMYPPFPDFPTVSPTSIFPGNPTLPKRNTGMPQPAVSSESNPPDAKNKLSLLEQGITEQDVLFGRGGGTNNHAGNRFFRQLVEQSRPEYLLAKKSEKTQIAHRIVSEVRSRGGRWLKMDATGQWQDVGDQVATRKASQALREGLAVKMRRALIANGASETTALAGVVKNSSTHTISYSDQQDYKRQKTASFERK